MMSQSNSYSSITSQTAHQNTMTSQTAHQSTMTSQMHLGSNIAPVKRNNSNVPTDIPTDDTENHKLSHNPRMTLQSKSNKTGHKANIHYVSPSDIIPNMRLDIKIIKLKRHV